MRVLLVSANFRPSVGGIERFVEILAEGLVRRGHEVTVAACRVRGAPREERADGVRVVRLPASHLPRRLNVPYPLASPRALVRTLRRLVRDAEVVHVQDALYVTSVAALVHARRLGLPSVMTQHVAFVPQGNAVLDAAQRAAIATLGRSARLASAVVAVNPTVAEWAGSTWRLSGVRTLPVGVPERVGEPADRAAVRSELGLREDAFVALFAGRDVPKKRLDVFLAAGDPAYELVAVTDGAGDGRGTAHMVPFMPPDRFRRLLGAADAFVLPSEGEGIPLALQEALVAGVPCVVTREPGYGHYLAEDDVVFVPPRADAVRAALRSLAADPQLRSAVAERGRAAGRRAFGVGAFVDAYERLYEEVRQRR